MKKSIIFFTVGFLVLLPFLATAQEKSPTNATNPANENKSIEAKTKLESNRRDLNRKFSEETDELENKDGLYHIVITTEDHKSESIWIELDRGEQKFVTIKLDNGSKKKVSIQLDDIKPSSRIGIRPYDRFSQLTLQPISF